jgi:hypothetical protein
MKALDKNREKRYQAAMDFATAMREAGRTVVPMPTPAPKVEATTTPPWRGVRQGASAHTTEVGLGAAARPVATPSRDTPTLVPAAPPPAPPSPVTPAPAARTPASTPRAPTPAPPPVPERAPAAPLSVTPAPAVHDAPRPTPSRRPPPPVAEAPPVERRETGGGEGVAAALWGLRTLISWGILAYAVVLLALFAWPLLEPVVTPSTFFPVVAIGQPVVQWISQVLGGGLRVGAWDPVPLVLAVLLLVIRPRITNPLWRAEARYRARAASGEALG